MRLFCAGLARTPSNRTLRRIRGFEYREAPPPPSRLPTWPTTPVAVAHPSGYVQAHGPSSAPIQIARAGPGRNLPVYADYRHGRTKCYTVIRNVRGDVGAFAEELNAVLGGAVVQHKLDSSVVRVDGNKVAAVKTWLLGLGL